MALKQQQATLTEAQLRFLAENPFVGVLTTLRRDGSPHSTPVWIDVEDGHVPSTPRRAARRCVTSTTTRGWR
jgi:Pyridoxamine 5'-phosphate oxidase